MAKSKRKKTKRVPSTSGARTGRPKSTGIGSPMVVRMHKPQIKAIDDWINGSGISRPEAIRQLVGWALTQAKTKPVQAAAGGD